MCSSVHLSTMNVCQKIPFWTTCRRECLIRAKQVVKAGLSRLLLAICHLSITCLRSYVTENCCQWQVDNMSEITTETNGRANVSSSYHRGHVAVAQRHLILVWWTTGHLAQTWDFGHIAQNVAVGHMSELTFARTCVADT